MQSKDQQQFFQLIINYRLKKYFVNQETGEVQGVEKTDELEYFLDENNIKQIKKILNNDYVFQIASFYLDDEKKVLLNEKNLFLQIDELIQFVKSSFPKYDVKDILFYEYNDYKSKIQFVIKKDTDFYETGFFTGKFQRKISTKVSLSFCSQIVQYLAECAEKSSLDNYFDSSFYYFYIYEKQFNTNEKEKSIQLKYFLSKTEREFHSNKKNTQKTSFQEIVLLLQQIFEDFLVIKDLTEVSPAIQKIIKNTFSYINSLIQDLYHFNENYFFDKILDNQVFAQIILNIKALILDCEYLLDYKTIEYPEIQQLLFYNKKDFGFKFQEGLVDYFIERQDFEEQNIPVELIKTKQQIYGNSLFRVEIIKKQSTFQIYYFILREKLSNYFPEHKILSKNTLESLIDVIQMMLLNQQHNYFNGILQKRRDPNIFQYECFQRINENFMHGTLSTPQQKIQHFLLHLVFNRIESFNLEDIKNEKIEKQYYYFYLIKLINFHLDDILKNKCDTQQSFFGIQTLFKFFRGKPNTEIQKNALDYYEDFAQILIEMFDN